jgi:hypothetical protein
MRKKRNPEACRMVVPYCPVCAWEIVRADDFKFFHDIKRVKALLYKKPGKPYANLGRTAGP